MSDQLETAIRRFRKTNGEGLPVQVSTAAFRAAVEQRLAGLERDVGELRGRINGLIFVVIGAVVTQVVLKVVQ
jgi:hypothetical protein